MHKISRIFSRMILDSRGNPTIEVDLSLSSGAFGRASVPSGASVGSKEALELRDAGATWNGKGVTHALYNINQLITNAMCGRLFQNISDLDAALIDLDGSANKSRLGANAILAVSLAFAKAISMAQGVMLWQLFSDKKSIPRPMFNVLNGGAHADNGLDIQEFMIIPLFEKLDDSLMAAHSVTLSLKQILRKLQLSTNVGDEGGFAPNIQKASMALSIIVQAIEDAGFVPGKEIGLGLDVAATELYFDGIYRLPGEGTEYDSFGMATYLGELAHEYHIISIEDPMHESDYAGWSNITSILGKDKMIVGDDVFVTNNELIKNGIANNIANAALIKPNQIGTVSETLQAVLTAQEAGYKTIMSHRSGETEDTSISHLAVGMGCQYIKAGALSRTDRVSKYNELLRIQE